MTPDQIDVIGQWAATQLEKGESWERINAKLRDFPAAIVNALPLVLKLKGTAKTGADLLGPPVDVIPEGLVERIIEAGEELLRTGDVVHAELVEEEPVELDAETAAAWRELVKPIFLRMRKSGVRSVTIEKTADKQCLLDINMESLEEGGPHDPPPSRLPSRRIQDIGPPLAQHHQVVEPSRRLDRQQPHLRRGVQPAVHAQPERRCGVSEELKHSPAPWAAFQSKPDVGTNYWRIRTAPPESGLLDTIGGYCGEANARLIAAAPDLLEALRNIVSVACEYYDMDMGDNGSAALEAAYAAIAKAGGGEP